MTGVEVKPVKVSDDAPKQEGVDDSPEDELAEVVLDNDKTVEQLPPVVFQAEEKRFDFTEHYALIPASLQTVESKLTWWYKKTRPPMTDVINKLGGDNLFYVHAEGLILHLYSMAAELEIEGDEETKPSTILLQTSNILFMLNEFLSQCRLSGGKYELVFIDSYCEAFETYKHGPFLSLVRESLLKLLSTSSQQLVLHRFVCYRTTTFQEFIQRNSQRTIMLYDGGHVPCEYPQCQDGITGPNDFGHVVQMDLLHRTLTLEMNVALVNGSFREGHKFLARIIELETAVTELESDVSGAMTQYLRKVNVDTDEAEFVEFETPHQWLGALVSATEDSLQNTSSSGAKFFLDVLAVSHAIGTIYDVAERDLALPSWAQRVELFEVPEFEDQFRIACRVAASAIRALKTEELPTNARTIIYDVISLRLVLLAIMTVNEGELPVDIKEAAEAIRAGSSDLRVPENVTKHLKEAKALGPRCLPEIEDCDTVFDDPSIQVGFVPDMAVDLGLDLFEAYEKNDRPRKEWLMERFARFGADADKKIARWESKSQQHNKQRMQFLARTLNGGKRLHHAIVVDKARPHVWNMSDVDVERYLDSIGTVQQLGGDDEDHMKGQNKPNPKNLKKGVNKRGQIIAKNKAKVQANLERQDADKMSALQRRWDLIGAKYHDQPDVYVEEVLTFAVGSKRILDSFDDFPALGDKLRTDVAKFTLALQMLDDVTATVLKYSASVFSEDAAVGRVRQALVMTLRLCHDIYSTFKKLLHSEHMEGMLDTLLSFGFTRVASTMLADWQQNAPHGDKKLKMPAAPRQYSDFRCLPAMEADFQLKFMDTVFDRTLGSGADSRVLFKPDAWQKRLLDAVDRKESSLVVAPTASGKTFVVYYAMEQCLRLNNESVCVFVAPSRALARQVEAEIYSRMSSKVYPRNAKCVLSGTMYKEYASKPVNCQILITVPEALDMILTSAGEEQRRWLERCQYIIYDEIHCISEQEGGQIYEKLIQLTPCPYIALSATIGNVQEFHNWMVLSAKPCNGAVQLIVHNERFSDLRHMIYSDNAHEDGDLYCLNPWTTLHFETLHTCGMSEDFYVTASDLVAFQQVMLEVLDTFGLKDAAKKWIAQLTSLDYFYGKGKAMSVGLINKNNYRHYLGSVKGLFMEMSRDGTITEEVFNTMTERLLAIKSLTSENLEGADFKWMEVATTRKSRGGRSLGRKKKVDDGEVTAGKRVGGEKQLGEIITIEKSLKNQPCLRGGSLYRFCRNLAALGLLPCLVFNFSRSEGRAMISRLTTFLMEEQHDKYYGTEEVTFKTKAKNKHRLDEYKAKMAEREMQTKMKGMSRAQRDEQGFEKEAGDEIEGEEIPQPPKDIAEEFDPDFSFAVPHLSTASLDEIEQLLQGVSNEVDKELQNALRRGIGLHHEAMPKQYRVAVEQLFRLGYLTICITGTSLSLGVNMPCRTAVFAGDHISLTPTLFKQTSGRSGRRGYDSLGNVVFWDFSMGKIRRLMGSQLTRLTGEWPVDPTFTAREASMLTLLNDKEGEELKQRIDVIYRRPLYLINHLKGKADEDEKTMKLYEKITEYGHDSSIATLNELELLDGQAPDGFSSMVVKLYENNPGNIHISHIFVKGVGHKFLNNSTNPYQDLMWLLARFLMRQWYTSAAIKDAASTATSCFDVDMDREERLIEAGGFDVTDNMNRVVLNHARRYLEATWKLKDECDAEDLRLSELDVNFKRTKALSAAGLAVGDGSHSSGYSPIARGIGLVDQPEFLTRTGLIFTKRRFIPLERSMFPVYDQSDVLLQLPGVLAENCDRMVSMCSQYIRGFTANACPTLKSIIDDHGVDPSNAWYIMKDWTLMIEKLEQLTQQATNARGGRPVADPVFACIATAREQLNAGFKIAEAILH